MRKASILLTLIKVKVKPQSWKNISIAQITMIENQYWLVGGIGRSNKCMLHDLILPPLFCLFDHTGQTNILSDRLGPPGQLWVLYFIIVGVCNPFIPARISPGSQLQLSAPLLKRLHFLLQLALGANECSHSKSGRHSTFRLALSRSRFNRSCARTPQVQIRTVGRPDTIWVAYLKARIGRTRRIKRCTFAKVGALSLCNAYRYVCAYIMQGALQNCTVYT